jgi:hypothetical protein
MVFALSEANGERTMKIVGLQAMRGSVAEIVSTVPVWWTPTAKAEAIVGIALALQFSHGIGLLHGGLNSGNILFDGEGRIQIADFSPMRLRLRLLWRLRWRLRWR